MIGRRPGMTQLLTTQGSDASDASDATGIACERVSEGLYSRRSAPAVGLAPPRTVMRWLLPGQRPPACEGHIRDSPTARCSVLRPCRLTPQVEMRRCNSAVASPCKGEKQFINVDLINHRCSTVTSRPVQGHQLCSMPSAGKRGNAVSLSSEQDRNP